MDLTFAETDVQSAVQPEAVFKYGKYLGKTHKEILKVNPEYVIWVYENHHDNGGISRECYRLAQITLDEEHYYEEQAQLEVDADLTEMDSWARDIADEDGG